MRAYFAALLLGAIFAVSVAAQVSDTVRKNVSRWFALNVVPSWRFFGPTPVISDMHLLFRVQPAGGPPGRWQEIPIPPQGRWRALWNPSRLADKALQDMVNALSAGSHSLHRRIADPTRLDQAVQVSQPYLALLAWVMEYGGQSSTPEQRQFALVGSPGEDGSGHSLIFVSRFHSAS
jgi:hypothetical protein